MISSMPDPLKDKPFTQGHSPLETTSGGRIDHSRQKPSR